MSHHPPEQVKIAKAAQMTSEGVIAIQTAGGNYFFPAFSYDEPIRSTGVNGQGWLVRRTPEDALAAAFDALHPGEAPKETAAERKETN